MNDLKLKTYLKNNGGDNIKNLNLFYFRAIPFDQLACPCPKNIK